MDMELIVVVGSAVRGAAASGALQVKNVGKIHSLELAKLRKIEMEKQEEARKAHRESVRAEIEKRKKEKEEQKRKEEEKKMEEERKLMKEMKNLSKDLKNLGQEIKTASKSVLKKPRQIEAAIELTVEASIEAVESLTEVTIVPSIEEIVRTVEAPAAPSPTFEGSSASSKIVTADYLDSAYINLIISSLLIDSQRNRPSLARPSLIPRLTKKRDLLKGNGSKSDSDRESELGSPTGVLERMAEFGSPVSSSSGSASAALDSDDDVCLDPYQLLSTSHCDLY